MMLDLDTLAEDELWERRDELIMQRDADLGQPWAVRRIRMELIWIADALNAGMHESVR